jgi:hypothetical protein
MKSEAAVQSEIRLKASYQGDVLWRNNTIVAFREDGTPVRAGLCNESAKVNKETKSSDLIGIKQVLITQDMVGQTIGQFYAREVKKEGWVFTGTETENAQLNFINIVRSMGGDAKFISDSDNL